MFRKPPKRKFLLALARASRCASSPDDVHAVELLLRNVLLRVDEIPFQPVEEWLLQALVVHGHVSLKDYTTALNLTYRYRDKSDDCPIFFLLMADILEEPEVYYKAHIDNIYTAFYFLPSQPNLDSHEAVLILDAWFAKCLAQLGRSEYFESRGEMYRSGALKKRSYPVLCHMYGLRKCISWVLNQLSSGAGFTITSKHLRHEFKNPRDAEIATVFLFLSDQWLEENGASGNTIFWVDEGTLPGCNGVSDLETLKILSFLIIPKSSSTTSIRRRFSSAGARALVDKNFELLQRAIAGTERLWEEPDKIISFEFLQCLTSTIQLPYVAKLKSWLPSRIGTSFANAVLETDSTAVVERSITHPYRFILQAYDPPATPAAEKKPGAADAVRSQISRPASMFAMSMSSSDLSSMRRQRLRASALSSISSWRTPSLMDQLSDRFSLMDMAESARNRFSGQSFGSPVPQLFLPESGLEEGRMPLGMRRQRQSERRPEVEAEAEEP